jgi:hypothetical protein
MHIYKRWIWTVSHPNSKRLLTRNYVIFSLWHKTSIDDLLEVTVGVDGKPS